MTEAAAQAAEAVKEEVANDAAQETEQTNQATDAQQQDTGQANADAAAADAGGEKKDDAGNDKPAALPDNWRELGLDGAGFTKEQRERAEKLVGRYGSLGGVIKALVEKEDIIRSGKMKTEMPDAKDEKAMAAWRKEQDIPPTPEGYVIPEPIAKRLVDADKPILSSFTEFAHKKNLPSSAVSAVTEWYTDMSEEAEAKRAEEDRAAKDNAEDVLRDTWSRDEYKGNMTLAARFWEATGIPDLSYARLPDGRIIGSIPEFITFSSDKGREAFGDVVFASSDSEQRHNNRRAEIEKIRDTDFERYENEGLDKELRGLIDRDLKRGKK